MLDLKILLEEPKKLESMLKERAWGEFNVEKLHEKIEINKKIIKELQEHQTEKNLLSENIGTLIKKGKDIEVKELKEKVKKLSEKIEQIEKKHDETQAQLDEIVSHLPNWLDADVPRGNEEANVVIRQWGEIPKFSFKPKTHYEIGEALGVLDFEKGVKLAGSRFYTYWGTLAKLERTLISFMLELHTTQFKYTEVFVPMLVNDQAMYTTGQFPKFKGEYYTLLNDGLSLIPTSEVTLVNLFQNEIIPEEKLPIALTAASSCFRREAGAAGRDTRGLVRVHQFQKVELVQFVHPENSEKVHLEMVSHAEEVLRKLELPYRVILKATGDIGATATKSYDIEVWMPGLNTWLEISSISNCRDYQARRGKIRYKSKEKGSKTNFVHTLNGSGLAAGRCMIAIMENYQKEDGSFAWPKALL